MPLLLHVAMQNSRTIRCPLQLIGLYPSGCHSSFSPKNITSITQFNKSQDQLFSLWDSFLLFIRSQKINQTLIFLGIDRTLDFDEFTLRLVLPNELSKPTSLHVLRPFRRPIKLQRSSDPSPNFSHLLHQHVQMFLLRPFYNLFD